ncbi:MAG TPA: glycerol kinase GlpK [Rectinemataceae bacterium]
MGGPCVLAVDQSTQSTKAFVFDAQGRTVAKASKPHRQIYPQAGYVEHDPEEIFANFLETCTLALDQAHMEARVEAPQAFPPDPICLSMTNQRETVVAWDIETGEPLHNALVWQDTRGTPICRELESSGAGALVRERTGLLLDPYFSASKLAWLVRNSPRVAHALSSGRLAAGTVDSWIIWRLTGGKSFVTDYSNASRTMLFDLRRLEWDEELLEIFGLSGLHLPRVLSSDADFGTARILGAGKDLPIRGVMGDSHAALFGHRGWRQGDAKATFGTGSSLMSNIGPAPLEPPEGIVLSLAWGLKGAPSYVFEGNIHSTGYTLAWLKDKLGIFGSEEEAERLASELPDSGGVYIVPAFSGLGAPYWEQNIRACITGLSHGSDKRHLARAGIESIAYQIMDLVRALDAGSKSPLAFLHVDGGPTRNALLMQFLADMLGIPVIAPSRDELSAMGSALMGGLASGLWAGLPALEALPADATTYLPSMERSARDRLAEGWRSAVAQAISRKVQ